MNSPDTPWRLSSKCSETYFSNSSLDILEESESGYNSPIKKQEELEGGRNKLGQKIKYSDLF